MHYTVGLRKSKTSSGSTFDFNGESEEMRVFEVPMPLDRDGRLRFAGVHRAASYSSICVTD